MKSEILTLCEYASEHDGRLTIVDTFDKIVAQKFPWRVYFYVAARIDISDYNVGIKKVSMRIVPAGEQQRSIFEAVSPIDCPNNLGKINVVAGLKGLMFETEGNYLFKIQLDEDERAVVEFPFKVILKENE